MADTVLPPKLSAAAFDGALNAFAGIVGSEWVLGGEENRNAYIDYYAPGNTDEHAPSAAVAPADVEQVREIIRLANEHKVPLWPISRGKNLGYGGAAPRLRGSVVLDLGRLKKILEVDERYGYCLVEPGVGFFDLYRYLQDNNIPLWLSVPGNAWGSVVGHALDRGNGAPFGDHSQHVCGLEVILANGDLVRTGTGAMRNSRTWNLFKHGFGPSWDSLFAQSNFGVVTKMGFWLMPEPEASLTLSMELPKVGDIRWAIDTLFPLWLHGVIQQRPSIGNYLRVAGMQTQRSRWYDGAGAMPEAKVQQLRDTLGIGWWSLSARFFGHPEVNAVNARTVKQAFAKQTQLSFSERQWHRGEAIERSGAGIPRTTPLQLTNWRGGQGAHLTFSPVIPPNGNIAVSQMERTLKRFNEFGMDYYGGFSFGDRHIIHASGIIFDRDDAEMTRNARTLFHVLLTDAAEQGFSEYRTHISFMDEVANGFDFNNHALLRLNEKVKNALDPNGIIAPGKQGVWPDDYKL